MEVLCGGGVSGATVWVQDMSPDPLDGEIPRGVSLLCGIADGDHVPQMTDGRGVGVPTH